MPLIDPAEPEACRICEAPLPAGSQICPQCGVQCHSATDATWRPPRGPGFYLAVVLILIFVAGTCVLAVIAAFSR